MVECLRRNHDAMLVKYENYRDRNATIETQNRHLDKVYATTRAENEELQSELYQEKRLCEELRQAK